MPLFNIYYYNSISSLTQVLLNARRVDYYVRTHLTDRHNIVTVAVVVVIMIIVVVVVLSSSRSMFACIPVQLFVCRRRDRERRVCLHNTFKHTHTYTHDTHVYTTPAMR